MFEGQRNQCLRIDTVSALRYRAIVLVTVILGLVQRFT